MTDHPRICPETQKLPDQTTFLNGSVGSPSGLNAEPGCRVVRSVLLNNIAQKLNAVRSQHLRQAVILIEIDNIRHLNETQGYTQSDDLLAALDQRLRGAVAGVAEISRISGAEFVIIPVCSHRAKLGAMNAAKVLAHQLLELVRQPIGSSKINWMTASMGVAVATGQATAESLLQEADLALTAARAQSGNRVCAFLPKMRVTAADRTQLDADLRSAVINNEFALVAQPQVRLQSGSAVVTGYELLVRWDHPTKGILLPAHFIARAEETGLIRQIDRWVLERAGMLLARWAKDPERAHLRLSVNLSALHFRDPDLADKIAEVLVKTSAPPKQLTIEVTETMIMDKGPIAKQTMKRLRRMGLTLALDDFGTGFSSLNLLHQLPFNEIKIDRSFVARIPKDHRASIIISNMIRLSQALRVKVIAEGVETEEQMKWLIANSCRSAQGHLFGRPENKHIREL